MELCLLVDSCSSFSLTFVSHYHSWMHSAFPPVALKCFLRAAVPRSSLPQPRWRVPCHIPCSACLCPAIPPSYGENKPSCLSPQHTQVTQARGSLLCLVPLVPGCCKCCSRASCKGRWVHGEDLAGSCKTSVLFLYPHEAARTRASVGLCLFPPTPSWQHAWQGSTFVLSLSPCRSKPPASALLRASSSTLA